MRRELIATVVLILCFCSGMLQLAEEINQKVSIKAISNLKVIWSKPFSQKIRYIWNLKDGKHLMLRAGEYFYLVSALDGNIIWQKKYKNIKDAFVIKKKFIVIIKTYNILLVNALSGKETNIDF